MSLRLVAAATFLLVMAVLYDGESSFVPTRKDERKLERCLLRRNVTPDQCFAVSSNRRRRSAPRNDLDFDSATEYIFALSHYKNTHHTQRDAANAVSNIGSCSRPYRYIASAWKHFFSKRITEARMQLPSVQYRNGTTTTVSFNSDSDFSRNTEETLLAVDLVISRLNLEDVEVYGKYKLNAAIVGRRQKTIVHESLQATCPSDRPRSFVGGLNEAGLQAVSGWLNGETKNIKFLVEILPKKQIVNGGSPAGNEERNFDIGASVSAMILHYTTSNDREDWKRQILFPLSSNKRQRPNSARARRSRRRPRGPGTEDCHIGSHVQSYRQNTRVIRPEEIDLGECLGSCKGALTASSDARFNATNHALAMLQESERMQRPGNPTPTACCVPISYRALYFVTRDERGIMISVKINDMVPLKCGCQ